MKRYQTFLFSLLLISNFAFAQIRVERNSQYNLMDMYTLWRSSPSVDPSQYFNSQCYEGPKVGRDTINHVEQCGIRIIRFLAPNNVGENPRADRQGDVATLSITMNNVYVNQHPVYEQASWAAHRYVVVLLDDNVANLSSAQQWAAVWNGTVIATKRYDDNTPIDIRPYINATNADRITFGIRAEYENDPINNPWAAASSCIFGFVGTVLEDEQINVNVKNNFPVGKIKAAVDNPNPPVLDAPVSITDMTRKTLFMGAVEGTNQPAVGGYDYIWNDTEAPSNPSTWYKRDQLGTYQGNFSSSANTSRTLSSTEKNYSYVADMKKICNATFTTTGGTMTIDGIQSSSPITKQVVEQNTTSATCSNFSSNGVYFTFNNAWYMSGQSYAAPTITVSAHSTYNAMFTAKPNYLSLNASCNSPVGSPITISWTDIVDTHVSIYQIYRTVKHNGVVGTKTLLGTVSRGVGSYTDTEYLKTSSYVDLLTYEVRAFYVSDVPYITGAYTDPYTITAYGQEAYRMNDNNTAQVELVKELPTDYAISNYPNPFNPTTKISYQLPENGLVTIKVYDILGKEVAELVNEVKQAGYYEVNFDAGKLTSGIYIYTIQSGKFTESKKMMLMK